jgi:serine/threonine protein kinase
MVMIFVFLHLFLFTCFLSLTHTFYRPENILITEGGHIKLTDFGGCRPISEAAHEALTASKSQLGSIRDGDWKTNEEGEGGKKSSAAKMEDGGAGSTSEEDEAAWIASLSNEDGRVEGTVAYCAPEIVKGESLPCFLSDVWALGCVAYFVLRGRLPFFHDTVEGLKHSIVNFVGEDYSANDAPSSVGRYCICFFLFFFFFFFPMIMRIVGSNKIVSFFYAMPYLCIIFLTRDIFISIHLNTHTCKPPPHSLPFSISYHQRFGLPLRVFLRHCKRVYIQATSTRPQLETQSCKCCPAHFFH